MSRRTPTPRVTRWRGRSAWLAGISVAALVLAAGCVPPRQRPQAPAAPGNLLTVANLERINPRLAAADYRDLGQVRGTGVRVRGRSGEPGVQLMVGSAGQVVGIRALLPATEWHPWFDQRHGETVNQLGERPGAATSRQGAPGGTTRATDRTPTPAPPGAPGAPGQFYTQTIWFVDPDRLRGTTGATLPASALADFDQLKRVNPKLRDARRLTDFVPGMGFHWGFPGPGLAVLVDRDGRITGVEAVFPAAVGFKPYFDQMPGEVALDRGTGQRRYTQHVWFVDPSRIR